MNNFKKKKKNENEEKEESNAETKKKQNNNNNNNNNNDNKRLQQARYLLEQLLSESVLNDVNEHRQKITEGDEKYLPVMIYKNPLNIIRYTYWLGLQNDQTRTEKKEPNLMFESLDSRNCKLRSFQLVPY